MSGSKLVFAIFLIITLSVGGLLGFYFYLNRTTTLDQSPVERTAPAFSGFDQVTLDNTQNNRPAVDLGSYSDTSTTTATTTAAATSTVVNTEELLRLISAQPVAGHDYIVRDVDISTTSTPTGTSTQEIQRALRNRKIVQIEFIRYILRATGNIFETGTSSTSTNDRITNKTIPKLHEAFFNSRGDGVIIRNVLGNDGVQTRYLSLKPDPALGTSTIQNVSSTDLLVNITQLALSPDKAKLFSIRDFGPTGTISNLDGAAKVTLFESTFKEWLLQWVTTNTILLNTKPSGLTSGYLYSIDAKTGTITKVLGGILGLTSLASKDGQRVLYSATGNNKLELNSYTLKDTSNWTLPAETLPEKCVWGNKYTKVIYCAVPKNVPRANVYPDDWYLGLIHFNDFIWRMNLETGENKIIVDPEKQTTIPLDIINMKLSKNDDYLTFEDKSTLSLWGIKLNSPIPAAAPIATTTRR